MILAFIGENCTGKSVVADCFQKEYSTEVFIGGDFRKFDKNKQVAEQIFRDKLKTYESELKPVIYIISEREHLRFLPENSVRVYFFADIDTIKERFAERTGGKLPPGVAEMLESKHGMFDDEKRDFEVNDTLDSVEDIYDSIKNKINIT
ncbi:MAG: hypothetical protein LBN40_01725 [Oscillospiraceae bacterium]|nr:hypothetical protein [Oscillospiraceae bacterium]